MKKKNKGAGYCRNYAIKNSKSPSLAFIDSDDIWKKDKLETQLRFMEITTIYSLILITKLLEKK